MNTIFSTFGISTLHSSVKIKDVSLGRRTTLLLMHLLKENRVGVSDVYWLGGDTQRALFCVLHRAEGATLVVLKSDETIASIAKHSMGIL